MPLRLDYLVDVMNRTGRLFCVQSSSFASRLCDDLSRRRFVPRFGRGGSSLLSVTGLLQIQRTILIGYTDFFLKKSRV